MKKSFNLSPDVAQRVDDFIRKNPGVSFTLMVNQALSSWLRDPKIALNTRQPDVGFAEVDKFLAANPELMADLAK